MLQNQSHTYISFHHTIEIKIKSKKRVYNSINTKQVNNDQTFYYSIYIYTETIYYNYSGLTNKKYRQIN